MKLVTITLSAVVAFAASGHAQSQTNTPGAKRLFNDTSTGVRLGAEAQPRPAAPRAGQTAGGGASQPAPAAKPNPGDVTGLMYYVEVIQPSGQALRVNTNQVFHSGQRIRLHVLSNLTGRLTILQNENNGPFLPLFPNPQLRGGDNRVEQGKETVIPMEFDNKPSDIRLLLMLVAESAGSPAGQTTSTPRPTAASVPAAAPAPPTPSAPLSAPRTLPTPATQTQPVTQRASNDAAASPVKRDGPITEDEIRALMRKQATSKGLKVETDQAPASAATYVVFDAREENNLPAGTVAVEIRLNHQP